MLVSNMKMGAHTYLRVKIGNRWWAITVLGLERQISEHPPHPEQVWRAKIYLHANSQPTSGRPARSDQLLQSISRWFGSALVNPTVSHGAIVQAAVELGYEIAPIDEGPVANIDRAVNPSRDPRAVLEELAALGIQSAQKVLQRREPYQPNGSNEPYTN
jgi:hypothetical protein